MSARCEVGLIQIVEFLTEQAVAARRDELQHHFDSGCAQCNERLQSLTEIDTEPETKLHDQLLAQPLFDTQFQPGPTGVRGGATLTRRRLYEAENRICLDIHQLEVEPGLVTLNGQVLVRGGNLDEVADANVALLGPERLARETRVDELGDFEITGVPAGTYDLKVTTGSMEVIVRGIQL